MVPRETRSTYFDSKYYSVKTTVLKFNPTPRFREWGFALFFVYCDPIFDLILSYDCGIMVVGTVGCYFFVFYFD